MLLAQSWQAGPVVPTAAGAPRAGGIALVSSQGFLLMGGTPANAAGDAPVHLLSAAQTSWSATTPLEGLYQHGGQAVDSIGRVIVFAGRDSGGALGDSYYWTILDGNAGGIDERSGQAPDQGFAVATDAQGRVYSIGGSNGGSFAVAASGGRVERYDGAADAWTVMAPMPTPVADACACADGLGHILVFGGYGTNGVRTANVARYDVATNTWSDTAVPDLPAARAGAGAARGVGGRVYVIGGSDASGAAVSTVFVLDPAANTWSNGPSMALPRQHFGCTLANDGFVWAIGGDTTNASERLRTPICPLVTAQPENVSAFTGAGAGFDVVVDGAAPFTYQWRADGVNLVDGPTGSGSVVAGATTAQLGIQGVTAADGAHVYDCVITNACGSATSAAATLTVGDPAALPPAFLASSAHPPGYLASSMTSVDGGLVVGSVSYTHPQYNTLSRPTLWQALGAGPVLDLTPANSVGGSAAKVRNGTVVGWWWWPYTVPAGTGYYRHASVWTQNGAVHHNVQPGGFEIGSISDTDGTHHAGTCVYDETSTNSDGFYWPSTGIFAYEMTPPTAWGSGISAIDGGDEFGWVHLGYGVVHAAKWHGSNTAFVDLHPPGASRSYVYASSQGQQVGTVYYGSTAVAGMWAGGVASFMPLQPAAGGVPNVQSCRYGLVLGSVAQNGVSGAVVFRSSGDDWMDLHAFVPPGFTSSTARDVWIDPATGAMTIVGDGYNSLTGRTEALVWRSANVAATATRLGRPCPVTLSFTPDGLGGYDVMRVSPIWFDDAAVGTEIAAGGLLPANTMSAPLALGFAFPMPGGTPTTTIRVDDNGRVVADPAAPSSSSPVPAVLRLGPAVIAPFWTDLASAQGSVRFHTDPAHGFATVTWRDVPQAGASNGYTFQLRLRADGSFAMTYAQVSNWTTLASALADNVLIGCSSGGNVPDPGPSDYSVYPIASNGASTVYQWWQASQAPAHPEVQSHLHLEQLAWTGGALEVELGGITSATLGSFLIVGFSDPAFDVTALLTGMPGFDGCVLHAALDGLLPMTQTGLVANASLAVPGNASLAGLPFFVQGLQFAPGESLWSLVPSDAFAVVIGH